MKHSRINQSILLIIRVWMLFSLVLGLFLGSVLPAQASRALSHGNPPGSLDASFDTDGKVTTDFGDIDTANAVAIQPDDKIVTAGTAGNDFALARYNSDGSLDTSFDTDGKVTTDIGGNDAGNAVAIQSDGIIVVAGGSNGNFALARYNSDGSLIGTVTTTLGGMETAWAITIQSDGKIVLAGGVNLGGNNNFALARYNSDGVLDTGFGTDGITITDFNSGSQDYGLAAALQTDDKIIVVGSSQQDFALARYNSDGVLDTSFDVDGKVTTPFSGSVGTVASIAIQPDEKIIVAGYITIPNTSFALARYNSNGSLDTSFGPSGTPAGTVITDFGGDDSANALAIQSDGKIIATGYSGTTNFALARYSPTDGSLDISFGPSGTPAGTVTTNFSVTTGRGNAVALQSDGQIVMAGASSGDFALARYDWALFDVPIPGSFAKSSPANGAANQSNTVILSWGASSNATSYEYCYDITPDNACSSWVSTSTSTSATLNGLVAGTNYYWHVRAKNSTYNTITYSNIAKTAFWSFRTAAVFIPPSAFSKSAPANSTTTLLDPNIILAWGASTNAGNYEYCVDISNNNICNASTGWTNVDANTGVDLTGTLLSNTLYYWQVRAIGFGPAIYANGGTWWAFKTKPLPVAPALIAPANASVTSNTTPTFSWGSVATGNTYKIEISTNSTTFAPLAGGGTVSVQTFTPNPPLSEGLYYWRVQALNVNGEAGPWSSTYSFTIDTLAPPVPVLSSPADKSSTASKTPTLVVLASAGANRYQFQVSTDPLFGSSAVNVTVTTTSYAITAAQSLQYGTYYWRAKALDAAGNESGWSTANQFGVIFQVNPVDNSYLTTATPTFTWTAVTGALEYNLQVDKTDSFASPEIDRFQATGTSYASLPLDYGTHYWRMSVHTASGWSAWAPAWKFTLTPPLSAAPTLVSPANAALLSDNTPTLIWNMVTEDDRYEVQIDNLSSFASPEQTFISATGGISYTASPLLPDGVYYWRVRTSNYLSAPGPWSTSRSFTIDTLAPVAPALSAPAIDAVAVGTPAFSWLASAAATQYQFQYADDTDFLNNVYTPATQTTLTHTPPAMTLGDHYWRVQAGDGAGNWGLWSTARKVTITPPVPVAPVLMAPANAFVTNNPIPDFTWNAVGAGTPYTFTYKLEIATTAAFTAPVAQTFTGGVGILTYTATTLTDGLYYWRVQALNSATPPVAGPWSTARTFTLDATPPVAPALSAPADNAIVIGTPAFSWLAATGATKYQFEYADNAGFSVNVYTPATQTILTHTPTPAMTLGDHYWRVKAGDAAGNWGPWSARKVTINPPVPVAPVLTAPANTLVTSDNTPSFTWNPATSGNTYKLEIATTAAFTAPVAQTFTGGVGILTYTATTLADGLYYWRVQALNSATPPVAGPWSAASTFTVDTTGPVAPTLSAPADNAFVVGNPTFSWLTSTTATQYRFQSADDNLFTVNVYTPATQTTLTHIPSPAMTVLNSYYWHVQARDAAGNWGPWSVTRKVTINPPVPVAPVLTAPANTLVTNVTAPVFTWNAVAGTGITYEFQLAAASTFTPTLQAPLANPALTYTATPPLTTNAAYYWRVRALNNATPPVAGPWSTVWSFTLDTTGPAAPTLSAPADNAFVVGNPTFSWLTSVTATQYQFQSADDNLFTVNVYTPATQTILTHIPSPAMTVLNSYYWHVQARDAAGNWGPWSATRKVTINPPVPVAPVLTAPANTLVTSDNTPSFTWNPATSGNTYKLEIATTAAFTAPVAQTFTGGVGILTYTATTLADGLYYWRVQALNSATPPVAGPWSTVWSFTLDTTGPAAPVLSAPADNAFVVGNPTFSWLTSATATQYRFQSADDNLFTVNVYTPATQTILTHTPTPAMTVLNSYYWHVQARDAAGNWGPWSATRKVTINPPVPVAPVLTAPANTLVTNVTAPVFTWNAVAGTGITYEFQLAAASTFTPTLQAPLANPALTYTATPPLTTNAAYYWRVRALNNATPPVAGPWSTVWSFSLDTTGPIAPTLSAPLDNAFVVGNPTFSWLTSATATQYQFQSADDNLFTVNVYTPATQTILTHTPTPAMTVLNSYYWHVQARDAAGNWGPWSATRKVTINPPVPVAPVLTAPANTLVTSDNTPSFTWNPATSGNTYKLEISTTAAFTAPVAQTFTGGVGILTYTATTLADGLYYWRVQALNSATPPVAGPWSTASTFTVDTTGPAAPVLSAPADNAFVVGNPAFSWLTSATATQYQFQSADDNLFTVNVYTPATQTILTHTPTPAMTTGDHYWHVQAKDSLGNWGPWSATRKLTINPPVPVAPVLTAPANTLVTSNNAPVFTWNSVTYGNTYKLEISTTAAFTAPVAQTFTGGVGILTYTATPALTDGLYYWRVQALNSATPPVAGPWSTASTFTIDTIAPVAPALSAPADNAIVIGTPTFSWLASATATQYQFQYADDAGFSANIYTPATQTTLTHTPPAMTLGDHYWRVQARDAASNWSGWSGAYKVTINPPAPVAPVLIVPANALVLNDNTPDFTWNAVTYGDTYKLEISTTATFTAPVAQTFTGGVGILTYTATTLTDGLYYWRVQALNSATPPVAGPWSAARTFTLDATPPVAPALSAPADNAIVIGTPAFSWLTATGATQYQFQSADDNLFTVNVYTPATQTILTHTPTPAMTLGDHYWHVQARDAAGNWGPWSVTRKVTINPPVPVAPVLTAPANTLVTSDNTPSFTWNPATSGNTYKLEIATTAAFTAPVAQTFTGGVGILTYTATILTDGLYYWHVQALNSATPPVAGPWSAASTFTVDTTGPAAPTLSAPADNTAVVGNPTFSWLTSATATQYQFQSADDNLFTVNVYTPATQTILTHTPSPAMTVLNSYYWHVQARDAAGNWGPWSATRKVTINPPVPVAPVLTAPANTLVTSDNTPSFTWNPATSGNTYKLEIATTAAFTAPVAQTFTGGVGILTYTATTLADGLYYWRVQALNSATPPVAGPWSAASTFTVDTTGPAAPTLSAPADNAFVVGNPTFSWLTSATATQYQFQSADDNLFTVNVYTPATQTILTHTPTPAMTVLNSYYWHVQARDAAGNWGPWSATRKVTINPPVPVAPVLTAPANTLVTSDNTPSFTWNPATSGNTYKLEIATTAAFTAPVAQTFTGGVGILTYTATTLTDGLYYWRVQALNSATPPVAGPWSAASTFTVDTTGPAAPTLSAPADNAFVVGNPTFSWLTSATATQYQFQSADDNLFTVNVYTPATQAILSHIPSPAMTVLNSYYWHVQARDAAGNWGPWSAARKVTINPPVPVAPVLTAPANTLVTNVTAPVFTWNAVAGTGITYEFQLAAASTFTPTLQAPLANPALTYTATPPLTTNAAYYWRVRALNNATPPVAGPWSTVWSFTLDTTPPAAPALSAPADNTAVVGNPTFSWLTSATATQYQFQSADDNLFTANVYTPATQTTLSHIPSPAMTVLNSYYWHVQARDAAGNWGPWSVTRKVTISPPIPAAPVLTAPANALVMNDPTPVFTWNAVAGTDLTYEMQISIVATFATTVQPAYSTTELTYIYNDTPHLVDGVYYWRVRALNAAAVAGPWSTSRSFTLDTTGPVAPALSAPTINAIVVGTPTFSWLASATATQYQFQYADDNLFTVNVYTPATQITLTHTPTPAMTTGDHYWHVQARDVLGNWGPWSAARKLTINPPVPAAPVLISPLNGSISPDLVPTLTWNDVAYAEHYRVQMDNNSTFSSPEFEDNNVLANNITPSTLADGVYYWRVTAINNRDETSAWSAVWRVTVNIPPETPLLTSPTDAEVVTTSTPTFTWDPATGAASYQIQVASDSGFASVVYDNTAATTSRTSGALVDGTYFWQVRAFNIYNTPGTWSTAQTLTVSTPPGAPTLTSPTNNSIVATTDKPTFDWSSVTGAANYQIQVDDSIDFANPILYNNTVATNTWTQDTAMADGDYYWRVNAINSLGTPGAWSNIWKVTISIPLGAPTLTLPTEGFTVTTSTPTFTWDPVTGTASYQVQVANDSGFSSILFTDTEATTSHTSSTALTDGNTYYWRVNAVNSHSTPGAWSLTRTLTVGILVAPTLTSPDNGSTVTTGTPTFEWGTVAGASDYQVQVANDSGFTGIVFTDTEATTSHTSSTALTDGTYYWRVAARNTYGTPGAWSVSRTLTVNIPPTGPMVTIDQAGTQVDPASIQPVVFTVVFSEAVTGFDAADVVLSDTTGGDKTVTVVIIDASTYRVEISGITTGGTITAFIQAGAALNAAANPSLASTSTDNTVTYTP